MIVDYFEKYIDDLDEKKQCGFCWKFIHARPDYANVQIGDCTECCTYFILEWYKLYNSRMLDDDIDRTVSRNYTFRIFVGIKSDFDIQYHNELGESKAEGKYERYIKKIEQCLLDNFEVDICKDKNVRLDSWTFEPKINKYDSNLDGGYLTGKLIFEV